MTCPVCQSPVKFFTHIKGNINVQSDTDTYDLYECTNCSHIFRTNHLDKNIYDDTYYAYNAAGDKLSTLFDWFFAHQNIFPINFVWNILQNFSRYQNMPYLKNGTVLDVGGGDGFALNFYKKLGNKTYNVEILDWVVEASRKNGHETYKDLILIPDSQVDLIRINQVLEHVSNPVYVIQQCQRVLKPGGKIVLGIPNIRSISYDILKDNFDQLSLPDHIHFFSEKSIHLILTGFNNVKIIYPLHKYGLVSNVYKLLIIKFHFPNNLFVSTIVNVCGIPVNIVSKLLKKTHLIDIICYK
ncbi:MAG TPA: class I SAM-dependent methyltransferase [Candidatus Saccharimonadales bacterium]|nr:class I SAM-dependent methyltransferase [Candidatus Saccharimonadales bacterium]